MNCALWYEGQKKTQFLNFLPTRRQNRLLTIYTAVDDEPHGYEWRLPTQWHILNSRCRSDPHSTGSQLRQNTNFKMKHLNTDGWCEGNGTIWRYDINVKHTPAEASFKHEHSTSFLPGTYSRTFFGNAYSLSFRRLQRTRPTLHSSRINYLSFLIYSPWPTQQLQLCFLVLEMCTTFVQSHNEFSNISLFGFVTPIFIWHLASFSRNQNLCMHEIACCRPRGRCIDSTSGYFFCTPFCLPLSSTLLISHIKQPTHICRLPVSPHSPWYIHHLPLFRHISRSRCSTNTEQSILFNMLISDRLRTLILF